MEALPLLDLPLPSSFFKAKCRCTLPQSLFYSEAIGISPPTPLGWLWKLFISLQKQAEQGNNKSRDEIRWLLECQVSSSTLFFLWPAGGFFIFFLIIPIPRRGKADMDKEVWNYCVGSAQIKETSWRLQVLGGRLCQIRWGDDRLSCSEESRVCTIRWKKSFCSCLMYLHWQWEARKGSNGNPEKNPPFMEFFLLVLIKGINWYLFLEQKLMNKYFSVSFFFSSE